MPPVGSPGTLGAMALGGEQSYFKQIFELSPDPTWIIDGHRFVECNEAAVRTLGYASRDEFLNLHPSKLSPPTQPDGEDSYTKAECMMGLAQANGLHRFEWMHIKADGTDFVAEVTLSAIQLSDRQVIYCVWRDITERKQIEQALRASEESYRNLVEWSPEPLVVHDGSTFIYANPAAIKLFGARSAQDLVGKAIFDRVHPDFRDISRARVKTSVEQGGTLPMQEMRFLRLDGAAIDVEGKRLVVAP